jgi:hypothetical protein
MRRNKNWLARSFSDDNEGRPVRRIAIVTATVDQRQHRTPHLMNVQLVVGAMSSQTA